MSEMQTCSCGNPGSVDPRDGDGEPRCAPCRGELRRLLTSPPAPIEKPDRVVKVGRQSGDPFDVATANRRLIGEIASGHELVAKVRRLLPAGLDALDVLVVDGYGSTGGGPVSVSIRPCQVPGCVNELPCPDHGDPCGEPDCKSQRPCYLHDSTVKMMPVEAAAIAAGRGAARLRKLETAVHAIVRNAMTALAELEALTAPSMVKQLCSCGFGRPGVIEWGNPSCRKVPDPTKAGMCDDCWEAEGTWRDGQGLPPHERTKASTTAPTATEMCSRCGVRPATPGRLDGLCDADRMKDSRARRTA